MGKKAKERIKLVTDKFKDMNLDALLITDIRNVKYLTKFSGSSGFLLLTRDRMVFVTDFRYKTQAEEEVSGFELRVEKKKLPDNIEKLVKELNIKTIGIEADALSFNHYKKISEKLSGVDLIPTTDIIESLRIVKGDEEISSIKKAIEIAEGSFNSILDILRPGITEKDIALTLEYEMRKRGSGPVPFDIIVASGERSALPHATSSSKPLGEGDLLIIDWGAEADGYFCDITRTFIIAYNPPSPSFTKGEAGGLSDKRKIYEAVLNAQTEAIRNVKPGMTFSGLDAVARDFIKDAGYGEYFGHGLGHGVGLSVHEAPHLSWQGEGVLKEGMVFTIEPGIYIPGFGGVRIEDMVLLRENGAEVLTHLPKELTVI